MRAEARLFPSPLLPSLRIFAVALASLWKTKETARAASARWLYHVKTYPKRPNSGELRHIRLRRKLCGLRQSGGTTQNLRLGSRPISQIG